MARREHVASKTAAEIAKRRVAGRLVAETLDKLREAAVPGATTADLDAVAEKTIRAGGGIPSFKGYAHPPYPASICSSVNDEVVHAIPSKKRVLRDGDIISIDCGAIVGGWHGDAAITVPVGTVDPAILDMIKVCEDSLWAGLAAVQLGGR